MMLRLLRNPRFQKTAVIAIAVIVWLIYAISGQGIEFFSTYRDLVLQPQNLVSRFGVPLTYNPPWVGLILAPFIVMPGKSGYLLFMVVTILMFWYATREFSGKLAFLLVSAQLSWILFWGQIEALVMLGIALGWSALKTHSWPRMILALLLAVLKPQIGLVPILAIWWWSGKDRWKSLLGFLIVVLLSILMYGPWPVWFVQNVVKISTDNSIYHLWNSSIGVWALPLFIPALALKMNRYQRLVALMATGMLASPYMPYYSTILLFCFALPGWSVFFAVLGYFYSIISPVVAWNGIVFFPICVLVWLYLPYIKNLPMVKKMRGGIRPGSTPIGPSQMNLTRQT